MRDSCVHARSLGVQWLRSAAVTAVVRSHRSRLHPGVPPEQAGGSSSCASLRALLHPVRARYAMSGSSPTVGARLLAFWNHPAGPKTSEQRVPSVA